MTDSTERLEALVERLEKVLSPYPTEARREAVKIIQWRHDGEGYEEINWEFIINVLQWHAESA